MRKYTEFTAILVTCSLILLYIVCTSCYAGLAVSITTGDDWAVGTTGMGVTTETSGDTWVATGSSDTAEAVYIKADGTNWSPGSAAAEDTFVLKYDTSGSWSDVITNTSNGIKLTDLVISGTQAFDLQLTAPTSTSVGGEHALTVTLTATAWDLTVTDIDANTYDTVAIGAQIWMAENLNVGTKVTGVTEQTNNATVEKYCYSDLDANCTTDGGLYQWDEAMGYVTTAGAQGICPAGWHIPTTAEWYTLENGLATGSCVSTRDGVWECDPAGTALKPGGSSGFEGILAGLRHTATNFANRTAYMYLWSSSESGTDAWTRHLLSSLTTVYRNAKPKGFGMSVRCLKD